MNITTLPPFQVQIWVGLKETDTGEVSDLSVIENICQEHCDDIGDCVTVTKTKYIYSDGNEPGAVIGWISYPRFPRTIDEVKKRAINLAEKLMEELHQKRVTITTPTESIMLSW